MVKNNKLKQVIFLNCGGTWNMIKKNAKLRSQGNLDDESLYKLEKSLRFSEQKLMFALEKILVKSTLKPKNLVQYLSWVPHIKNLVRGKFISLFEGDSSHFRSPLIASIVALILKQANSHPSVQILGAQGTDTADIAILPLVDAYIFDTELLPIIFTGSNRSRYEWNSDATKNISNLIELAGVNLPSGAYWIFSEHIYKASDMIKIDPMETRRIENYLTFFAPRQTTSTVKKLIAENHILHSNLGLTAPKNHISCKVTTKNLYDAMTSVGIIDLGDQNNVEKDVSQILDKGQKAIIIAAHSLGNAGNPIKEACGKAALSGKLVIVVSRSPIGEVNERYLASLLGLNSSVLLGTGKQIISGHKMNKNVAKAIVTRAVQENLDQKQTQALINDYCTARGLMI